MASERRRGVGTRIRGVPTNEPHGTTSHVTYWAVRLALTGPRPERWRIRPQTGYFLTLATQHLRRRDCQPLVEGGTTHRAMPSCHRTVTTPSVAYRTRSSQLLTEPLQPGIACRRLRATVVSAFGSLAIGSAATKRDIAVTQSRHSRCSTRTTGCPCLPDQSRATGRLWCRSGHWTS
jgi:hypothetical protein